MKEIPLGYLKRLNSQIVQIVSSKKYQPQNCSHDPKLLALVVDWQLVMPFAAFLQVEFVEEQKQLRPVKGWPDALARQEYSRLTSFGLSANETDA